jgi:hypothetical protein
LVLTPITSKGSDSVIRALKPQDHQIIEELAAVSPLFAALLGLALEPTLQLRGEGIELIGNGVPMAKVGIISRLKAVAWSLKTRKITSGLLSFIHCLEAS